MKKSTKIFIILLIAGTVGLIAMTGAAVGTKVLYSRDTSSVYEFETPHEIRLETVEAQVVLVPAQECRVDAFVKAWRPEEIDMDDVLDVRMEGNELVVTETPFADDFLGLFPQPYELKLTIYAPQHVLDAMEGDVP